MRDWKVYVPTYGRKTLPILEMLDDDKYLTMSLCVREECKDDYQEIVEAYRDRVRILNLGSGIKDLGETRKRILSIAEEECDYCVMLDDSLTEIYDYLHVLDISVNIERAIGLMKVTNAFCYTFFREGNRFLGVSPTDKYFVGFPLQAFIINTKMAKEHNVNFETMEKCGLEDIAFFADAVKEGLIFVSDQDIRIRGKLPNTLVKGGSHAEHFSKEDFERKRDEGHKKLMEYIGPMYGIMLTKKYRPSLDQVLTYCRIDCEYFRDVLVYHRKENQKIIDSKFRIEGE